MIVSSKFPGIIPMYKNPQISNMCVVSELLPTEPCIVLKEDGEFFFIQRSDGFKGWVLKQQLAKVEMSDLTEPEYFVENGYILAKKHKYVLPPYSPVWNINNIDNTIHFNNVKGEVRGKVHKNIIEFENIFKTAKSCIGIPFKCGGRTVFGFDAPGLIQFLFRSLGVVSLSSDITEQVKCGYIVPSDARNYEGDVLFFCNNRSLKPSHVGLLLPEKMVVHVSPQTGFVVCEKLNGSLLGDLTIFQANRLLSPLP
jgi:hypothetical protein